MTTPALILKTVGADPDQFQIYDGYWNDYSKPVIVGDWNHIGINWSQYRDLSEEDKDCLHKRDNRVVSLIESKGFEIDWIDQVSCCEGCYKVVRSDDSVFISECCLVCPDCAVKDSDTYIESNQDNPETAIKESILSASDLIGMGWRELEIKLENGLHPGQNDMPQKFYDKWREDYDHLLFMIQDEGNPFTTTFSLFGKNSD